MLRLTLDRPTRRNALSHSMVDALVGALTDAATDDSLRAIHLRGEGATSAPARTGWPPTAAANGRAPATWSGASPTPRTG